MAERFIQKNREADFGDVFRVEDGGVINPAFPVEAYTEEGIAEPGSAGTEDLITLPQGAILLSAVFNIVTAFDAAGDITLGDGTTVDQYVAAADVTANSTGQYGVPIHQVLPSEITVALGLDQGTASATSGEVDVTLLFAVLPVDELFVG